MMNDTIHIPVLLHEIIDIFQPLPGQCFVDGTANGGGHAFALWEKVKPNGTILAIDKDCDLIRRLAEKAKERDARIVCSCGSYADAERIIADHGIKHVSGILLDLGYSSYHIEGSGRGFSFQKNEPLIMRYEPNATEGVTARDVVNEFPEQDLADIFYRYGEERFSRRIAREICTARKRTAIETTQQLADIVSRGKPRRFWGRIHPATKVFQALRIYVNEELADLERALPALCAALESNGKIAIITFHSLEDRIVKHFFKQQEKDGIMKIITKKPIVPTDTEMRDNPRARSAKLRVAIKE